MKILLAIKGLGNLGGGAERVFVEVANGLSQRGHDVFIISYDREDGHSFYKLDPKVNWMRLCIGEIDQEASFFETLQRMWALRRTIRKLSPDVAIGFMHSMYIPLGFALQGTGIPFIASEHTVIKHFFTRPFQRFLIRTVPFLAQVITVVSEQAKQEFPSSLQRKMRVVQNTVKIDVVKRADVRGELGKPKTLLSVGRLSEEKNFDLLIDAFSHIAPDLAEWNLRIIGEGKQRLFLEDKINQTGLADRIFLAGAKHEIELEYQKAQLFVLPSRYESFGLVLVEALAHGLPGIGFADCPGVNRFIKSDENGVLVTDEDKERGLAYELKRFMNDEALRVKNSESDVAQSLEFDFEQTLDLWEQIIYSCTSSRA